MNDKMGADIINAFPVENQLKSEPTLPPWLFRHPELIRSMASADYLDQQKLTNVINHLHFKGNPAHALLNHPQYEENILVKVFPEPCAGHELVCIWDCAYTNYKLENYRLQYLIICHGQAFILVPIRLLSRTDERFTIDVPKTALVISRRQFPRYGCRDVNADIWQNGVHAGGDLVDFSPQAFRLHVHSVPSSSFHLFNTAEPITINLSNSHGLVFSGICKCLRENQDDLCRELVLLPTNDRILRFKAKALRNPRRCPSPPFYAIFDHPLSQRKIQREIADISTSGFSIQDKPSDAVLIPGMIIPEMVINYAGVLKIQCKAQVIYRNDTEVMRFGLAILDMSLESYNTISQLLNNNNTNGQDMSTEVDLDELWDLFFDTDFIYPSKYEHIHKYRDVFQETFRKLYSTPQLIAKHFTYQKNGRIYSHLSLLRAYEKAWMIHHHAARPLDDKYTGLKVLKQLIFYLNDAHHLPSANMDYVFCYLRPENKYNDRLYTGFAQAQSDASVTSLDLFSYIIYDKSEGQLSMPQGWSLRDCNTVDLWELRQFYKHNSGGLLCDMLYSGLQNAENLENVYSKLGFIRKCQVSALHFMGILKAVIVKEESDIAINLSDLMNGFKVIVIDPELPSALIFSALNLLIGEYETKDDFPVMIYPDIYAQRKGLHVEKQYYLWILNMHHGNEFMKYLGNTYRIKLT